MFYIAIVGRPNVGKSTLFNKIIGGRPAIVDDTPGVTRDRNVAIAEWRGKKFGIIDSGGFEPESRDKILSQMREQTMMAIEEADLIFLMVDGREGVTSVDEDIAKRLRKSGKRVSLVVNKMDSHKQESAEADFMGLGFEDVFPISAEHSIGLDPLLKNAVGEIKEEEHVEPEDEERPVRIAVVGKPNAGKSSLVNTLLGKSRMMVSDVPGTTRDAIDTEFTARGKRWVIIDTAGIRRKAKVTAKLEKYSVIMAMKAIERADVALLMIDGTEGAAAQETKIAGLVQEAGKACVIVVNKWDAVEKDEKTALRYEEGIRNLLKFLVHAPVIFVSATTGQRVSKILEVVEEVGAEYNKRIATSALNGILEEATKRKEPPVFRGKRVKLYFATQASAAPPTFVIMANYPDGVHFSYQRYLANRIREQGGFNKTPIRLLFRKPAGRRTGERERGGKR
ncbi:MAG: ribosome biogenesis GTPase Der [Nitrospinae bacterium]|nr:ribosome biogenesis GTPase Der [Nitrospinota bacterium]